MLRARIAPHTTDKAFTRGKIRITGKRHVFAQGNTRQRNKSFPPTLGDIPCIYD